MARRFGAGLQGNRYIGDKGAAKVHDLDNEDKSLTGCQIDKIIFLGNIRIFMPDALKQAHCEGYTNCEMCLGRTK